MSNLNLIASTPATLWSARVTVTDDVAAVFEAALANGALSVSSYEIEEWAKPRSIWQVEALFADKPPMGVLSARIAVAAVSVGIPEPAIEIIPLPPRNWLAESYQAFPPITAGRFRVFGDHIAAIPTAGLIPLKINASTAFGSGEHESTYGCLLALSSLHRRPRTTLDLGCGSGILSLAAAKSWRRPVVAADVDPEAVRVTLHNARRNQVRALVSAVVSDGCAAPDIHRRAPFDLITANILARPLCRFAKSLAPLLAPGGRLIMAGLLDAQESIVLAAYRPLRLRLVRRFRLGAWSTLMLAR